MNPSLLDTALFDSAFLDHLRTQLPQDEQLPQRQQNLNALSSPDLLKKQKEFYRYTNLIPRLVAASKTHTNPPPLKYQGGKECRIHPLLPALADDPPDQFGQLFTQLFNSTPLQSQNPYQDPFVLLNNALFTQALAIQVPANTQVSTPLIISNPNTTANESGCAHRRLLLHVGSNSHLCLIQQQTTATNYLDNWVIEARLEEKARLSIIKLQTSQGHNQLGTLIDHTFIAQQENSQSQVYALSQGNGMVRNNLYIDLQGKNSHSELHGVLLGHNHGHIDHQTQVAHSHAHTSSHQTYRSALSGHSQGVFNGIIYVRPQAIKTNAYQSSKNLLLSQQAHMHAKPQLEIEADDVRCSHGCTTGGLNQEAMFYLISRGIPHAVATELLTRAWIQEALENAPEEAQDLLELWIQTGLEQLSLSA